LIGFRNSLLVLAGPEQMMWQWGTVGLKEEVVAHPIAVSK
jgi:hypothetical protein